MSTQSPDNVLAPADVASAEDAAAEWFVAHDRGLSGAEQIRFERWRDSSPLNSEAWHHAQILLAAYDTAHGSDDGRLEDFRAAALALRPSVWTRWPVKALAVAACLLLTVGAAGWYRGLWFGDMTHYRAGAEATTTQFAEQPRAIAVKLADGSNLQIDAHSVLDVRMLPGRRDLTLKTGRAFFSVAHDTTRPFVVTAADVTVTATGTAFAVTNRDGQILVVLQTGHVEIAALGGSHVTLDPGQEYRFADGKGSVQTARLASALAWQQGMIDFRDTPIAEALDELNQYSDTKIGVADHKAGQLRITGRFPYNNAPAFAEALAAVYPVHVERLGDGSQAVASNRH